MSVIGIGMIARRFIPEYADDNDVVVFASGVSNSKESDPRQFEREETLLRNAIFRNPHRRIIYFGTCSMYDPSEYNSPYVAHKIKMESIIKNNAHKYFIFRTTNLVGHSSSPHLLINYLVNKISKREKFDCWVDAHRNLLDIDDFYECVNRTMMDSSDVLNIINQRSYSVKQIVEAIEQHFCVKAKYNEVKKGSSYDIPAMGIRVHDNYLPELLKKYYPA